MILNVPGHCDGRNVMGNAKKGGRGQKLKKKIFKNLTFFKDLLKSKK